MYVAFVFHVAEGGAPPFVKYSSGILVVPVPANGVPVKETAGVDAAPAPLKTWLFAVQLFAWPRLSAATTSPVVGKTTRVLSLFETEVTAAPGPPPTAPHVPFWHVYIAPLGRTMVSGALGLHAPVGALLT
jgi:hypothetical protein